MRAVVGVILSAWLVEGCATPPAGFDSPDPGARLDAIARAVARRESGAIPHLIESLDSDDPAERLAAIRALERLTGQTLGYDHAAPPAERDRHARAWWAWYLQGSTHHP